MKLKLLWDWDAFRGTIGSLMAIVLPYVKALTPFLQFIGALAGVILVCYSIIHKRMEIKKLKGK